MQSYKTSKSTKRLRHFSRNGLAFDQLAKAEQKDLEATEYSKIDRKTIIQFHVAMVASSCFAWPAQFSNALSLQFSVCSVSFCGL